MTTKEASVAQLIVRDLSEDLVKALKQRAAKRHRGASEIRKGDKANPGVRASFANTSRESVDVYLSVVTIGELRQVSSASGVEGTTPGQSVSAAG
jgi:hypothetical protein